MPASLFLLSLHFAIWDNIPQSGIKGAKSGKKPPKMKIFALPDSVFWWNAGGPTSLIYSCKFIPVNESRERWRPVRGEEFQGFRGAQSPSPANPLPLASGGSPDLPFRS
jgi:hypothetical protein